MIKGCRKNMIVVKGGNEDIFETVYFILKDRCSENIVSDNDMLIEAEKIIEKNLMVNEDSKSKIKNNRSKKKRSKAIIPFAAGATVGSAVGLLLLFL